MITEPAPLSSEALSRPDAAAVIPGPYDPPSGLAEPLWLEGNADTIDDHGVLQDWIRWVTHGAACSICLHPNLVLAAPPESAAPLLYLRHTSTQSGTAQPACLAALAPKARRV